MKGFSLQVNLIIVIVLATIYFILEINKFYRKRRNAKFNRINSIIFDEVKTISKKEDRVNIFSKIVLKFKSFVKRYEKFGGNFKALVQKHLVFYTVILIGLFLFFRQPLPAFLLSLFYIIIPYNIIENLYDKRYKQFFKGFTTSLQTLSSSIQAGHSLHNAIEVVTKSEHIPYMAKREFEIMLVQLNSAMSMTKVLDDFYRRNEYPEVALFTNVLKTREKTGGKNSKKIFEDLANMFLDKSLLLDKIDTKSAMPKSTMKIFSVAGIGAMFGVEIFMPGFYQELFSSPTGVLSFCASYIFLLGGFFLFKKMMRSLS